MFTQQLRWLVTGGAGFIGSHIVHELVRQGQQVTVLDNLSGGKPENLESVKDKINFIFIFVFFCLIAKIVQTNETQACLQVTK